MLQVASRAIEHVASNAGPAAQAAVAHIESPSLTTAAIGLVMTVAGLAMIVVAIAVMGVVLTGLYAVFIHRRPVHPRKMGSPDVFVPLSTFPMSDRDVDAGAAEFTPDGTL